MQIDPVQEWRRLAAEYREKTPEELVELARDFADLTEIAQRALRSELKSRGLGDPENPKFATAMQRAQTEPARAPLAQRNAPADPVDDIAFGVFGVRAPELVPDRPGHGGEDGGPYDYTWKTPLCICDSREEAIHLQEALRRAGIESWINFDGYTTSFVPSLEQQSTAGGLQILVAADQLDQARAVAAQPIPQEIVDESKQEIPDFVEPKCPKCGSDEVVLEGVDPANTWRCEQCNAQWTESMPNGTPEGAKKLS